MPEPAQDVEKLSPEALQWVADAVGLGTTIQSVGPMAAVSTSSTLLAIEALRNGRSMKLVLRRFVNEGWLREEPDLERHEAASLEKARVADVPTPELIAYDEAGDRCCVPAVLMTRLPGSVELNPGNLDRWLYQLAESLIRVHAVEVGAHPWSYSPYNDIPHLTPPGWSRFPELWGKAIGALQEPRPEGPECFIHRDYHPANVLWVDNRVSGIVDWVNACRGPVGVDVGWCRRDLVQLYGQPAADRFLHAYRSLAGPSFEYHPYWDLMTLVELLPGPPTIYPGWTAFGVHHVNRRDMIERLDEYLASVMARL